MAVAGAGRRIVSENSGLAQIKAAAATLKLNLQGNPDTEAGESRNHALVFDASGLRSPSQLRELYDFIQPQVRAIARNGRVLLVSPAPESIDDVNARTAATALRGFIRSPGKDVGQNGTTADLIEIPAAADDATTAPPRFFPT